MHDKDESTGDLGTQAEHAEGQRETNAKAKAAVL
jgi:hypothetical protein